MTDEDESELHRLCAELNRISRDANVSGEQREVLKKAAIGLGLAFIHGLRDRIEFVALGQPLTEAERTKLIALGIDPDDTSTI